MLRMPENRTDRHSSRVVSFQCGDEANMASTSSEQTHSTTANPDNLFVQTNHANFLQAMEILPTVNTNVQNPSQSKENVLSIVVPRSRASSAASSWNSIVDHRGEPLEKHRCTECRMCYVRRSYLIRHVMGKHGSQRCCLKCMQLFDSEKELNQHMLDFHSRNICNVCGGVFPTRFELKKHINTHRDSKEKLFKCPFTKCTYSHNSFQYFEYHINKHRERRPFCCGKCKKEFSSRYMFNRHVKVCIGDFGKCPKCDKEFTNDSTLYDHIQACHIKRIYVCPHEDCHNTYKWRASLSRHLTNKH